MWPRVLGIIALVFAVGGVVAALMTMVSSLFMESALGMMQSLPGAESEDLAQLEAAIAAGREWRGVIGVLSIVRGGVAVLLFAGGVFLTQRKRISGPVLRAWAILQGLFVLASVGVDVMVQRSTMVMPEGVDDATAATVMNVMAAASSAFGLLWGWALPIFVLIWFSRRVITREVGGWA
jgi:hypothetical protein